MQSGKCAIEEEEEEEEYQVANEKNLTVKFAYTFSPLSKLTT